MRRIDALGIGLAVFLSGGFLYAGLVAFGIEGQQAGIWAEAILVVGLVGWLASYLLRVATHKMTYNQQLEDYETAVLEKRLEELSPEELAALQAEIDREEQGSTK
jgi:Protein of unknown function (DUF3007)